MTQTPMARPDGPRVRQLRLRKGWTQEELARRIRRTQPAISKVERGKPVSYVLMRQVAKALRVGLSEIKLADEEQEPREPNGVAA